MMYKKEELLTREVGLLKGLKDGAEESEPTVESVKEKVKNELKKVDIESNEHVRDLKMRLKITGAKRSIDDDDDIEEVVQESTEKTYICPYTQLKFKCPMKK